MQKKSTRIHAKDMKRHEEDMKMATKHIRAEFYINILKKMKIKSHNENHDTCIRMVKFKRWQQMLVRIQRHFITHVLLVGMYGTVALENKSVDLKKKI